MSLRQSTVDVHIHIDVRAALEVLLQLLHRGVELDGLVLQLLRTRLDPSLLALELLELPRVVGLLPLTIRVAAGLVSLTECFVTRLQRLLASLARRLLGLLTSFLRSFEGLLSRFLRSLERLLTSFACSLRAASRASRAASCIARWYSRTSGFAGLVLNAKRLKTPLLFCTASP